MKNTINSRRTLLKSAGALAILPFTTFHNVDAYPNPVDLIQPDYNADFWQAIRTEYSMDRTMINLNNGGVSPSPKSVIDSVHKAIDYANLAPARNLWQQLEPGIERVREGLADMFGTQVSEIAITRNASESLQNIQLGMSLSPGDEVLTTIYDYPRMITAWEQRVRRDNIILKKIEIPMPLLDPMDAVHALEKAITKKTKVIHVSHIPFCTGQIMPIKAICEMAKKYSIECIVDGAHSFAHIPFKQQDLQCDYFATSLHKWLYAPIGTGMLYVKKEKIPSIWPLMAAPKDMDDSIKKFEEIGTHQSALHNAISDALAFNERITVERKAERLRALNKRWIDKIKQDKRVSFSVNIDDDQQWCGIIVVMFKGFNHEKIGEYLMNTHRIISTPLKYANIDGLRITPNIYIAESEIDYFAQALLNILDGKVSGLTK